MIGGAAPVIQSLVHHKAGRSGNIAVVDKVYVTCLVPFCRIGAEGIHGTLPFSGSFSGIVPMCTPDLMARMFRVHIEIADEE